MSDQDANATEPNVSQDESSGAPTPNAEPKPPWGSDDEFNPQKAWNLIQNLRGDLEKAKPAIQRAKELEDASKTDTQRLTEERDTHRSRADEAEARLLRLEIGLAKGLTPAQSRRLVGTTKAELEADADDLLASFGGSQVASSRPTERLRGGGDPDQEPEADLSKIAADIPRR